MSDRRVPGESLSRRISQRSGGLNRRTMSDGGEVYSGPVARQALRALGARAMTMDHTILVDDDFDESNPEDQALYAHERFHQLESGGADHPHSQNDAEELGAQAIERMVLHRSRAGEDLSAIMRDVRTGGLDIDHAEQQRGASDAVAPSHNKQDQSQLNDAQRAYQGLIRQGKSHAQIVQMLTTYCMELLAKQSGDSDIRSGGSSRW